MLNRMIIILKNHFFLTFLIFSFPNDKKWQNFGQVKSKMSEPIEVAVKPSTNNYITLEELTDPDNEIIFVQHSEDISSEMIAKELFNPTTEKELLISQIPSQVPIYPVAFGEDSIHTIKAVDRYCVATHK